MKKQIIQIVFKLLSQLSSLLSQLSLPLSQISSLLSQLSLPLSQISSLPFQLSFPRKRESPEKTSKFKPNQLIICWVVFLFSCQNNSNIHLTSRSEKIPAEERQALLPNDLFIAVADKKNEEELKQILEKKGHYLFTVNDEGDTALGTAIQFHNLKGALFLAGQLSPEHYLHQNSKGEGYVYLAAQKAYINLIQLLANRFYESQSELFTDYEFSDLDMKTKSGERALHTAKNYATAEALEYEYWRGTLEFPYRKFQFLQNNKGQTFLHTAVRGQNSDLLRWGVRENCLSKQEWEQKAQYKKFLSYIWRGLQFYGGAVKLDWDNLINTTDNQQLSPLNQSAKNLFLEGIQILSTCQWLDYLSKDEKGNTALQNLLLTLDPLKPKQDKDIKLAFNLLMEGQTRLTWALKSDHINSVNQEGNSSLHISAELADPFFYNQLKKYGSEEQTNAEGKTAKEIFQSQRLLLEQSYQ
ncbi:MAG: hypothetical protein OXJ52_02595 [Oligoflexia bacterium]|nr:hypothetical protein [Oligoflexia bacterium]